MRWHGDEGGVPRVRIRPAVRIGSGAWSVPHRSGRRPHDGRQRTASPRHLHPGAATLAIPRQPLSQLGNDARPLASAPLSLLDSRMATVTRRHRPAASRPGPVSSWSRDARVSRAGFRPGQSWPAQGAAQQLPSRQRSGSNSVSANSGEPDLTRLDSRTPTPGVPARAGDWGNYRSAGSWVRSASAPGKNWRVRNLGVTSACASMTECGSVRSPAVRPASTCHVGRARPGDAGAPCGFIHRPEHQPPATTHA
jgi:hypothetical protein